MSIIPSRIYKVRLLKGLANHGEILRYTDEDFEKEMELLIDTFVSNGYEMNRTKKVLDNYLVQKDDADEEKRQRSKYVLWVPYVKGFSES